MTPANSETAQGMSRRTVVTGAAWAVPVVALAVAVPAASASTAVPTDIQVTLQPTPPVANRPLRLTYSGTSNFDPVPFPAGSTVTITIGGALASPVFNGLSQTSSSGTNPVTYLFAITNLNAFYVQGTPQSGTSITVTVYDASNNVIGSDSTTVA
ncbi:hypothetical protein B7R22_13530 [Subtercola boreus]|uniref:Uncharacterized protein n=1 Tax=Subtercola boreus TaxID=120213 RepID=A0A3E0VWD5_9MICO|nr:hypothetical protein [Subtercola boreus]RFA13668.1 hypothetical protein B7R22_13530 [Subtercola boreus]